MKFSPSPTPIRCPFCQTPITVQIHHVIDAVDQPELKSRLLAGQLNTFTCTNCRNTGALSAPFLYHDAEKELALVFLPMESGMDNTEQQRAIGRLTQTVLNALPPEKRKAYLLQPQQFFTMQSLLETVLQADGVTPEMIQAQQERIDLLQRLIDTKDDTAFEAIVKESDAKIDETFIQLVGVALASAQAENRPEEIARLTTVRDRLFDLTRVGQKVKAQTQAIEALMANPSRETLLEQLLITADADTREALLAVGRSMLDYPFFQQLTGKIDAAKSAGDMAQADRLTALRKEILALRDKLDAQAQQAVERRATLLRELMVSQNVIEAVQARAEMMDDLFFSVLTSEMQTAQQAGDMKTFERLQHIGNAAMQVIQSRQPPEVQVLSALLGAKYPDQTRQLLERNQRALVPEFIQWLETIAAQFREDGRNDAAEHLTRVVAQARELSGTPAAR